MAVSVTRRWPAWTPAALPLGAVLLSIGATGVTRVGAVIAMGCYGLYAWAFWLAWRCPGAARWVLRAVGAGVIVAVYAQAIVTHARPWNPNIMATLLLLTVPFGYQAGLSWWLAGLYALGFTGARAAWVAVPLAVFILLNWPQGRARLRGLRLVGVGLLLVGLTGALIAIRPGTVLGVRLPEYIGAARAYWARPTGSGPWSHRVDSLPLTVAAELGFPGLVAWAGLSVSVIHRALHTQGNPARLACLLWLSHQLADYTLWDIPSTMLAAAALALLFKPEVTDETGSATSAGITPPVGGVGFVSDPARDGGAV